jgi:hypothetical protein
MKGLFIFNIIILLGPSAFAQTFEWAKEYGGPRSSNSNAIVANPNGNNYFTGVFNSDTLLFGKDTFTSKPIIAGLAYANKLIIGKHNKEGKPIWGYSPTLKNNSASCEGYDIALNNANLYITGDFNDTVIFSKQDTLYSGGTRPFFF